MADGKTQIEALKNVELIVEEWIETAKKTWAEISQSVDIRYSN